MTLRNWLFDGMSSPLVGSSISSSLVLAASAKLNVCLEGHRGEVELLGNEEYLLKRFRLMAARVNAVYGDGACRPAQQSADKVKQCRLSRAVLSQQSVDVIVLKVEAEAVEDVLLRALVLVFQVLDVYHFIVVFRFLFYRKLNESGVLKELRTIPLLFVGEREYDEVKRLAKLLSLTSLTPPDSFNF